MKRTYLILAAVAAMLGWTALPGCQTRYAWDPETRTFRPVATQPATQPASATGVTQEVPKPIDLLLPQQIRIHPFTGTRTFHEAGGISGLDVHIEALDAYGDATKAFGDYRFELYQYIPNRQDPKGQRLAVWDVPLLDAKKNLIHWNNITRKYTFKLQWDTPIAVGVKFVLVAVFSSPFTERLFSERVFTAGE